MNNNIVQFDIPTTNEPKIIKVVGVGGGGCNAVNHMHEEGINGVDFMVCNTDSKALNDSPVCNKLQLGQGLGAGNKPEVGRQAAEDSADEIRRKLNDGTRMVFITAGMGGGTGTGAAPVIARIAREMDILTVGIVTIPYQWEGDKKIDQALDGVEEINKYVDALIVIKNDKLSEVYSDLGFEDGYDRADNIVLVAAKSISDIITMHGKINLDFNDVRTVLKDGGVAIMGTGYGEGESRVTKAIQDAQNSPLLNNNDIFNAKKVAFCISYSSESELMMSEMEEVKEFMSKFSRNIETKHGVEKDETLGKKIKITLLATGFGIQDINMREMDDRIANRSEEEQEKIAEEEERRRSRREMYYGPLSNSSRKPSRRRNIYIFDLEDLDNDDIIRLVEESPTYKRDKSTWNAIRQESQKAGKQADEEAQESTGGDEPKIINF
ncbi:MAG: cell division protein FtsZ [Bacteroides sp.]|nr:cell division protein FtsZ [Bacteroides sp.]